jgi:hypothetical protein
MSQFSYSIGNGATLITFPAKPSECIRAMLKAAGFRWSPSSASWWRSGVTGAADFLAALDRKLNPARPDGACWRCQSPEGFFRRSGAATPVYCDACWTALNTPDRSDLDYEDPCRDACGL